MKVRCICDQCHDPITVAEVAEDVTPAGWPHSLVVHGRCVKDVEA